MYINDLVQTYFLKTGVNKLVLGLHSFFFQLTIVNNGFDLNISLSGVVNLGQS